jgi:transposase
VFRSRAVFVGQEVYSAEGREEPLEKLPEAERKLAEAHARQLDCLQPLLVERTKWLRAARSLEVRRLQSVPGIGLVRAATIVAVVGTPHRFRTSRQFWSYCGLGIVRRTTGQWHVDADGRVEPSKKKSSTRGLNKNRNASLKDVFKGAALTLLQTNREHPLACRHQERVKGGMAPEMSSLTLARQLAAIVLSMWKRKEDYDPSRHVRETSS